MSRELGVGVRVWVNWAPADAIQDNVQGDPRLSQAVITSGPFEPGFHVMADGSFMSVAFRSWNIKTDSGVECAAAEKHLTPIDDDDDASEREAERQKETAL